MCDTNLQDSSNNLVSSRDFLKKYFIEPYRKRDFDGLQMFVSIMKKHIRKPYLNINFKDKWGTLALQEFIMEIKYKNLYEMDNGEGYIQVLNNNNYKTTMDNTLLKLLLNAGVRTYAKKSKYNLQAETILESAINAQMPIDFIEKIIRRNVNIITRTNVKGFPNCYIGFALYKFLCNLYSKRYMTYANVEYEKYKYIDYYSKLLSLLIYYYPEIIHYSFD